ncbi:MAG: hypothetical protein ABIR96_02480 [Bdellovibrionota bacterium]
MKKLQFSLALCVLVLAAAACNKEEQTPAPETAPAETMAPPATEAPAGTEAAPAPVDEAAPTAPATQSK